MLPQSLATKGPIKKGGTVLSHSTEKQSVNDVHVFVTTVYCHVLKYIQLFKFSCTFNYLQLINVNIY